MPVDLRLQLEKIAERDDRPLAYVIKRILADALKKERKRVA